MTFEQRSGKNLSNMTSSLINSHWLIKCHYVPLCSGWALYLGWKLSVRFGNPVSNTHLNHMNVLLPSLCRAGGTAGEGTQVWWRNDSLVAKWCLGLSYSDLRQTVSTELYGRFRFTVFQMHERSSHPVCLNCDSFEIFCF